MDYFSLIISLTTIVTSFIVNIVTIRHQTKINEDNNKRLIESEKINNENQLQLKRLDYYYSERSSAIFKYLDNLFDYLNNPSSNNLLKYQSSMVKVSMYVSGESYSHVCFIDDSIKNNNFDSAKKFLKHLMDALSADSQQYK